MDDAHAPAAQAPAPAARDWHVYLLRCADGSLYCGVATDVARRAADHATARGARYVRAHGGPDGVVWSARCRDRGHALRLEARLKRLPRARKLAVARGEERPPEA